MAVVPKCANASWRWEIKKPWPCPQKVESHQHRALIKPSNSLWSCFLVSGRDKRKQSSCWISWYPVCKSHWCLPFDEKPVTGPQTQSLTSAHLAWIASSYWLAKEPFCNQLAACLTCFLDPCPSEHKETNLDIYVGKPGIILCFVPWEISFDRICDLLARIRVREAISRRVGWYFPMPGRARLWSTSPYPVSIGPWEGPFPF